MPNPLYNRFGNNVPQANNNLMNAFRAFASNFSKQSNMTPQQRVQELLNSGQMTQEQFESLRQMANQLTGKNY